ncbi:Basement membrane-specific heparan sulfate proteoglycan core protein [Taenia crassiceps]|uniref:Basement membrane-specific heparan sulfate proteoglycan core protein n=1 Tax=Taenia crassiceps TaxID=6207 RepID=A0ABR4QRE0_9CEST
MGAAIPIAGHRRASWFYLLRFLVIALLLLPSRCALPHLYQANLRLKESNPVLELRCPLYQAVAGDVLVYSDMKNVELMRVILQDGKPAPVLELSVEDLNKDSKAFVFFCRVFESKTQSLVSKATFVVQKQVSSSTKVPIYETLHYDPNEVKDIKVKLGQSLRVKCPIKAGAHQWFRAGGEQMLEVSSKNPLDELTFTSIKMSDLGIYYCGARPTEEGHSLGLSLFVQKFIIKASEDSVLTRLADVKATEDYRVVQLCRQEVEDLGPSNTIIWERPVGVVHLLYSGKHQIALSSNQPFYCSIENHDSQPTPKTLVRSRRSITKPQFILREVSANGKTATVECRWVRNKNVRYEWLANDGTIVGRVALQEVGLVGLLARGTSTDTDKEPREHYTCQVFDLVSGEKLGESTFSGLTKFKPPDLNSVELSEEPDDIIVLYPDDQLELHCDIPPGSPFRARDIDWYVGGGKLGRVPNRVNLGKSSILGFTELSENRTATYSCRFGETVKATHIIVRERAVSINIEPKEDYKSSGINDMAEFHCRVTGMKNGGRNVRWSFIPEGSTEEQNIPLDVEISEPEAAPATAFLFIQNPEKRHAGQYICRIRRNMDVGKLIVEDRRISVNPKVVTARPGSTVRFFCTVTLADGGAVSGGVAKVSWFRKDRRSLSAGREEIIAGTTAKSAAILVVKNVDNDFNKVVYVCTDGFREAETKILIQEVCGPGERSCGGDKCISESLFCNGVPDCPDGSDEIPERCRECEPNQYACLTIDGQEPSRFCYLRSWHCDGEDDCGNGFDETNCPAPNPDTPCSNKFYICPEDQRPIPRSYLCDSQIDCTPSGSDEVNCSRPSIIYPPRGQDVMGIKETNVTLKCVVHGRPPPTINWRFNWGPIKTDVDYVENTTTEGCDRVTSYLTLINIDPRASGMYTCEAVTYQDRVLAPDYTVNVGVGSYCTLPKFNDAAWNEDMCLDCYCAGVSNDCSSLRGYSLASSDKVAKSLIEDVRLVEYDLEDKPIPGELQGLQLIDATYSVTVPEANHTYLEGTFGLNGDWITSYSLFLKANVTLLGPMEGYQPFAAIVLEGNGETIYYCGPSIQPILYTDVGGYQNQLQVRLTERDGWVTGGFFCEENVLPPRREQMMKLLSNVEKIRFRVKLYEGQEAYKLMDIRLEHVVPTDAPGTMYPEIESCKCPEGYWGLSCQQCERGYEHDPKDPTKCRLACSCEECDAEGNCIACPGNATGADCSECRVGFYRPLDKPITSPCLPCEKCGGGLPHVSTECTADPQSPDGYRCRCEVKEDGRLLDESCDLCKSESPPPEAKCEERSELLNLCNPVGTKSITTVEICNCKEGYEGERCRECSEGYMQYGDKCLPCYCAGKTKSCKASETHFFENATLVNPGRYKFDVFMSRKLANGELVAVPLDDTGKQRIELAYAPSNINKVGPPEELFIREPLISDGISQVSIKISDTQRGDSEADIPVYRSLYGGKMSFRFKRFRERNPQTTVSENRAIVTIESPKFGTFWTTAVFNPSSQRYEVEFSEDWWNGRWRAQDIELSRAALLRVLATASSIGISMASSRNALENARIGGLSLEIARDFGDASSAIMDEGLRSAPVEICDCGSTEGRSLSPSCEGCTDLSGSTVVNIDPYEPDFQCGECKGPQCDTCPAGQFKYDFLTNTVYDTCQKGVNLDTEGRVVVAEPGSRVALTCRATSYRGGIPIHTWRLPALVADSPDITIKRELLPFKPRSKDGKWSAITSEAQLQIENAKEEYSGLYECQVAALGTNLTEPFYLIVRDPAEKQPSEPGDTLNGEFPVPMPVPDAPPFAEHLTIDTDERIPTIAVIEGKVSPPNSLNDFHIVWLAPNGTQITPIGDPDINPTTGEFSVRLPDNADKMTEEGERIYGFLVGKDPVKTPIWVPLPELTRVNQPVTLETVSKIKLSHPFLNLSFLEPAKVRVVTPNGKPKNVKITWQRLGSPPLESSKFSQGMEVNRDGDLIIYAAGEEHEGDYEATVTIPETGNVVKLRTKITVQPWSPPTVVPVPPGQAGENPEEVEDIEPPQSTADDAFVYYVSGFTPNSPHCKRPKWILMDEIQNASKDITTKVNRENEMKFVINYPLTSGKFIKFECLPVPTTNLSGSLQFNIESPDPRIILGLKYDDPYSVFPTRLACTEGNPTINATVTIVSDSLNENQIKALEKPRLEDSEKVELDWRRVGGFQPSKHLGKYTCKVQTPTWTVEKSVTIKPRPPPEELKLPIGEQQLKLRVSSPGRILLPLGDDQYRLDARGGQPLQLVAEYDFPSDTGEITWSLDDSTDVPEISTDGGHSWKRISIAEVPVIFDHKVLNFAISTPDGEKSAKVTLSIIPDVRPFAIVNLNSSALVNGDLVGLSQGNMDIDVMSFGPDGSELPKDLETFWRITQANGAPVKLDDGILARRYSQPYPSRLELQGLPRHPTEFRISAAVVIPMGDKKELFTSLPYRLIVRETLIKAFIHGLTEPGVLSGPELDTVGVTCIAKDIWRNRTVEDVTYDWDYVTQPEGRATELRTSSDKVEPDKASRAELPWSILTFQDNSIYMGNLRNRPGWVTHIRCRAKTSVDDKPVVSDWFKLNVIPSDMVANFPKIEFRPTFDSTIARFPIKIECLDTNTEVPSTVTWSKDGQSLPSSVKVETAENTASLSWSVNELQEFSPRELAGVYVCEAKNEFRTATERLFLPSDIMESHDQEKNPVDRKYIRIKSTHTPIEVIDEKKHVTVDEGEPFELVCEYYGYPPPAGGVNWRLHHNGGEGSTNDVLAKINGLAWERGRNYWALVQSDAFNRYAPQTGVYTCEALDESGRVLSSDSVNVDVPVRNYNIEVKGLDKFGTLYLQPGGDGNVSCSVTDPATGKVIPTFGRLKKLEWEGPMVETENVKVLNDLAHEVYMTGEDLSFRGVNADLPEGMKGKCVFWDGKVRTESEPFLIIVQGEGGTDGKVKTIVESLPGETPNQLKFQCNAFDTYEGQHLKDAIVSWYFTTPGGNEVLPSHLFKDVKRESNTIVMTGLRNDVDFSALAGGDSVVEGRCIAFVPITNKKYPSEPFLMIGARDEKPQVIEKPKIEDKPIINVEGDDKGDVPVEEGKDVSLKCRLEGISPNSSEFPEGYTYHWQIARKDGRPVDTSIIADTVEVIPLPDDGLELRLTGLKASAAGLEARCSFLIRTNDTKHIMLHFPRGGDLVTFTDSRTDKPHEKPKFTGTPDYDTVPENDKRNKYIINVDGLDDLNRLAEPLDSEKTLQVKIMDKETGEEVPVTDPAWKAAGLEVRYADGRSAPLSHLAKEVRVDSNTGEIKLVGYKGDSELDKGGNLFIRVIAEKTPTKIDDDTKLKPGQLGNPNKERFASPLIPVTLSDRDADDREKIIKLPPLVPIVHGLSKCRTVALESGKDIILSCKARGVSDESDLLFAWEMRDAQGRRVPMTTIAKSVNSLRNQLRLTSLKTLAKGETLLGRCVIGRKTGSSEKYYSRDFLVGPLCNPVEDEVAMVDEIPSKEPEQRQFRCVVTKRSDGSVIPGATYSWEFTSPSGELILPNHLFESLEFSGDTIEIGRLRSDIDFSAYFADKTVSLIEGRCVALVPPADGEGVPKTIFSDPMVRVFKEDEGAEPVYTTKDIIEDDRPRADVDGTVDNRIIAKPDDSITLKCVGVDDQTGANLGNVDYLWEVQTKDGRSIDTSALAEKVVLTPAFDGSGYELRLIKIRHTAKGLFLRCKIRDSRDKTENPKDQATGDLIDVVIESDPDKPEPAIEKPDDTIPIPDSDPRKSFRVQVSGLDSDGNIAGPENATLLLKAELIDEFTNEKADIPEGGDIRFGLEATKADGRPASLNLIANSVEVDSKSGEIRLIEYRGDQRNFASKDLRMRFVAERIGLRKRQRFASPYFYPVLTQEDKESIEDYRPAVREWPELKPIVIGLSDCRNLPIEVGAQKTLVCDVSSPTDDSSRLIYGWELRDENFNKLPFSGSIADFAKQSGKKLELAGLLKPGVRTFGRCVVARLGGSSAKYYSEYFEIGATCKPGPEELVKVDVHDIPRHDPKEKSFECFAYDPMTGARLENATFVWRFRSVDTGEIIPPSLLFGKVTTEGNRVTLSRLRVDVDLEALAGSSKVYGECIADVPRGPDGFERDIYSSGPKFFIERETSGDMEIGEVKELEKEKVKFEMTGVEGGRVIANEGDNKVISCVAVDPETRRPVEGLAVQWVLEHNDGTVVDTSALAKSVKSLPLPSGATLRLQGIYKTASGLRAKCVAANVNRGLGAHPGYEGGPLHPSSEVDSPYIDFDVKSVAPEAEEEKVVPKPELLIPKDFKFQIDGLDEDGNLAIPRGDDKVLDVRLIDPITGEELPKDPNIKYGVKLVHADKSPASLGALARGVEMNSETGKLKVECYQGDVLSDKANDLFLVFTVERSSKSGDGTVEKFASQLIPVKTLDKAGEPLPDHRKPALRLPDLKPLVLGLSECGNLEYNKGDNITLKCKARGLAEGDDNLVYAWEVIKPGGNKISMAGILAKSVEQEGSKLRLINMLPQKDMLFGRCLIARKAGNRALYGSYYFRIGGECKQKGKTVLRVDEVPTLSSHERKFTCKSIDSDTSRPIQAGNFIWEFVTSSGEVILPSHIFSKVEIDGDTIQLSRLIPDVDLSKLLGPNDGKFIMGRCRLVKSEDGDGVDQLFVPPSDPFIVISQIKDGDDKGKIDILETIDVKDDKPDVIVKDAADNRVNQDENDSVTLTCEAQDKFSGSKINGLTYAWEIRTKDNRPVDTSALADRIELLPIGEIILTGLKQSAAGLRARCVLINDTLVEDEERKDQGVLPPGETKPGAFIDFNVRPGAGCDILFNDTRSLDIDKSHPSKFKVQVEGLDANGALSAKEGDEVVIVGKLVNTETGEDETDNVRFGIEASYYDGSPAPLGLLGDTVTVDSKIGEVKVTYFKGDRLAPQSGSLRLRVVAERISKLGEPPKPKIELYASNYIPLVSLDEDGTPVKDSRPIPEELDPISPKIEGLSPCNNLILQEGYPASVYCKATDELQKENQFVYGWELFTAKGFPVPLAGMISSSAMVEGSALRLTDAKDSVNPIYGRCVVSRKAGDDTRYFSPRFQVGGKCGEPEAIAPTTTTPVLMKNATTHPEEEEAGTNFTGTTSDTWRRIRFQLTGINSDRIVVARPGDDATLSCTAYDAETNEVLSDATISWEFNDLEQNKISPMRIANKVAVRGKNTIDFTGLHKESKAGGRCLITLEDKATISTPFFYFHVTDDDKEVPAKRLLDSETPVEVLVEGLNEHGQISVKQIGDDAQLTCKVIRKDKNEIVTEDVRFGWEWRYLDNDPAMTSNVAVGIKIDGDSMELRGIRAPEGLGGRGIKGRCVLYIPAKKIEPEATDGHRERKFTSQYFMVVVDRVPVTIRSPIPGHEIDGVTVEIEGAVDGELKASQGSAAKLDCVVKNATSGKPISAALYAIVYGWEFRDASSNPVDSSFFAKAVNIEPHGSLRLSRLSAPSTGRFPMRIRCYATIARRLLAGDRGIPQPRYYTSDYVGLLIVREDGTVTAPEPGQPEPDLQGNRVGVYVKGLHLSGDLKSMPGEDVELLCVAIDKKADQEITGGQGVYDWSLLRPNGLKLSNGQLAKETIFDGPRLVLKHVRLLDPEVAGSMGRCEVFYNGQTYFSPFFKFDFTPKHPVEQIEGDGMLVVDIDGANKALGIIELTPDEKTLQCFAVDSKTQKPETGVAYDWEYYTSLGDGLTHVSDVTDPERVKTFKEGLNGKLIIKGTDNQVVAKARVTRLRCRVTKDGASYTSPYYSIRLADEKVGAEEPDEKPVPRYWARITGLDSKGRVSANPGDTIQLGCQAIDTKNGNEAKNVDYLWEVRSTDGRMVDVSQIASGEVSFGENEITLRKIRRSYGNLKGRCIIMDRSTREQFHSPFFNFAVPPTFAVEDIEKLPPLIRDASPQDDRMKVWVTELNMLGNLNGMVGQDVSLKCHAEAQVANAEVIRYSWQFIDRHAQPISPSVVANEIQTKGDRILQMNGLRAYKDRQGYYSIGGRCLAHAKIVSEDGKEEQLRFPSKYFQVVVRDTKEPVLPKIPEDLQGEFVIVRVDGLDERGNLKAEPGDTVTLTCKAKDIEADVDDVPEVQSWKFIDSLGREVTAERLAMSVTRSGCQLTLTHLRPTTKEIITRGKCVIFSERRKRLYSSVPFDVVVKRRDLDEEMEGGEVVVEVSGDIADNVFTGSKGGDGKLYCFAKYVKTDEPISPEEARYAWEFEINGQLELLDSVAGDVAAKTSQFTDPNNPQVAMLQFHGLGTTTKWTRARCSVTVTEQPEGDAPVGKTYYSPFFTSGEAFDFTTPDGYIITDPDISIRVLGLDSYDTVIANVGDDKTLTCSAIDMTTGLPIESARFTWDLRTIDDQSLTTNRLAERVRALDGELQLYGLKESSKFVRARCLATLPSKYVPQEGEPKKKLPFYASPAIKFQVTLKEGESLPTELKDISNLKVEVHGISPSGTLTDVDGNNRTLDCVVTDKWIGAPIVEGISVGWNLATGPDNQPFELSRLTDSVEFDGSKLILTGLRKTAKYSGGLRGQCIVSAEGGDTLDVPVVKSDVFAIHILPKPSVDLEEPGTPEEDKEKELPDTWLPGPEPKDAVVAIIHELNRDGDFERNVGADATLTCVAHDTKTQQQLKVGSSDDRISLRFGWELRDKKTGEELSFNHLASGQVTMTQTSKDVDPPDSSAASRLHLEGLLSTAGKSLHGRCTVSLNGQRYHSAYFSISVGGRRVPGSVVTVDDIPGYYESDNAVTVVVSPLHAGGGKVVYSGDDATLTCTAMNSKSRIPLPEKSVFYGWRLVNAEGHELPPERLLSVRAEGDTLTMNKVSYTVDEGGTPEPIYGWCVAGVKRATGLSGLQRYRSDTFIIHPNGKSIREPSALDRPELTVSVTNVGGDEDFLVRPGEDVEMVATVTDAKTGHTVASKDLTIGWEWTDVSGLRPISLGEFAAGGEELKSEGSYNAYDVRLTQHVRGRAVVTYSRPEEGQKWYYTSAYFFLSPDSEYVPAEGEKPFKEIPFDEADDKDVLLTITGLNNKGQFVVPTEGKGKVTVSATDAATGKALTEDTEPALVGYGWDVIHSNGLPTHSGDLAKSVTMDAKSGKLTMTSLQPGGQQALIRMTALVEVKKGEGEETITLRKRYKSDPIPVLSEADTWPDDSTMDLTMRMVTVTIEGLDENGDLVVNAGENAKLRAVVKDALGADLKVTGYSWMFADRKGYPVVPSLIAKSVERGEDGSLQLSVIQPSAMADGVRGRSRVAVEREGGEGPQYYESSCFIFKSPAEEETGTTDSSSGIPDKQDYGFTLKIRSDTSIIYPNKEGDIVMARPHLPLELDCVVEFAEGVTPRLSENGTPIPQLSWYYRRPEIPGDVPIPAEIYRVDPGKLETLLISKIGDRGVRISSDLYDFRDDLAEFQCHAMDGDKTLAKQTVFINRVKERVRVQVFDENSRTAVYVLENSKTTLSCYVEDEVHGGRVDPLSYKWEIKRPQQGWDASIESGYLAATVEGVNAKDLVLDGLLVSDPDQLSTSYQLRCVAQYNETYFVVSRGFAVNVHRTPELKSIRLVREKPEEQELLSDPARDIYDAGVDYLVSCKPEFSTGEVQSVWEKYDEEFGVWEMMSPPSDKLFFVADSTEYQDEGQYRCHVSHDLQDYDYHVIKTRVLELHRIAGPAPSAKDQQIFAVNDELMLQCNDRSASPQVEVEWSFKPSGDAPPEGKDPLTIGSYFQHDRTNVFIIPRGQLLESHSGTYTCTRTNEHGQATTAIRVIVKPDYFETAYTVGHRRA